MIFYPTMKNAHIDYILDLPGESPIIVVDAIKIRQVFLHLIKNALEAMPLGGTLTVSCQEEENRIVVTITDTGAGITDANLRQAKDPFFTTKTYGTGMGLTLVEKITKVHNGSFIFEHNAGGGMIAKIGLPKTLPSAQPGDAATNEQQQ
jgi:signal transduction histidine kinase